MTTAYRHWEILERSQTGPFMDEEDFYEAISSFKGASKRLEKIGEKGNTKIFKDYAHSPSKVAATTGAVKEQFPDRKLIACLELHTYSSLNAEFLKEYRGSLNEADVSAVFYIPESLKIKGLDEITKQQIGEAFQQEKLHVFTNSAAFKEFLFNQDVTNSVILFMSSGDYGGLDLNEIVNML